MLASQWHTRSGSSPACLAAFVPGIGFRKHAVQLVRPFHVLKDAVIVRTHRRSLGCSTEAVPCTLHLQNMHKICFKQTTRANKDRNALIWLTHLVKNIPGQPANPCSKFSPVLAARTWRSSPSFLYETLQSFVYISEAVYFHPINQGRKIIVNQL